MPSSVRLTWKLGSSTGRFSCLTTNIRGPLDPDAGAGPISDDALVEPARWVPAPETLETTRRPVVTAEANR
jgi:hypothetical protein